MLHCYLQQKAHHGSNNFKTQECSLNAFSLSEFSISQNCKDAIWSYNLSSNCSSDNHLGICLVTRVCCCCCNVVSQSLIPAFGAVPCQHLLIHCSSHRFGILILSMAICTHLVLPKFISVQSSYGCPHEQKTWDIDIALPFFCCGAFQGEVLDHINTVAYE